MLLIELGYTKDAGRAPGRACSGSPTCSTWAAGDKRGALTHRAAGAGRGRRPTNGRSRRRGGWPPRAAAGPSWSRPTRRRCRAFEATEDAALALLSTLAARVRERAGESRGWRSRATRRSSRSRDKDPSAVAALERLYIATGRFADLLAIYDKKLSLAKTKAEELEIRFKLASLYEEEIKQPDKAIELYARHPEAGSRRSWRRCAALDRLYQQLGRWKELSETIVKEIDLSTDMAAVAELKFRRGAVLEQYLAGRRGRGGVVPRGAGDRPVARRRAHRAAGVPVEHRRRAAARGRQGAGADLRGEQRLARLVEVQRIKLAHEKKTDKRVDLLLRIGELEGQLGNTDQAWEAYTRAVAREPGVDAGARGAGEPGQHPRQLAAAGRAVREGAVGQGQGTPGARRWSASCCWWSRSPTTRSWRSRTAPSSTSGARRASSPKTRRRWSRWSGCTRAPSAGAIWSTRCSRRRSWSPTHAEREEIRIRTARVWEEMLGNAEQAIVAWNVVLQDNPGQRAGAARARPAVHAARRAPRAGRQPAAPARIWSPTIRPRPSRCWGGWARCASSTSGSRAAPSTPTAKILQIEPEHRETIAALERIFPNPEHELDVAMLLEPIYKARGDWPQLIGVLRDRGAPRRRSRAEDRALQADRRGLRDRPGRSGAAPTRRWRGRWPRIRRTRDVQASIERLARALRQAGRSGRAATGSWSASVADPRAQERAVPQDRAPGRGWSWATTRRRRPRTSRRWMCGRAIWTRPNALEQLYLRRADYPNLVKLLLRKAEIVDDVAEQEDAVLPRGAALRRGARRPRTARSACSSTCCRSTTATRPRSISSSACTSASARWNDAQERLRQEGGAGDDAGREEADAVRARAGLRPRARRSGTRDRDLQLDPGPRSRGLRRGAGARSAVSAARTLVRPARRARAADRAGAVARRGRVAALPHRRAVARAPEGSGARGGGLPPGAGDGSGARADDPRAGSADERQGRAGAGRRGARADLRERGRVGSRRSRSTR